MALALVTGGAGFIGSHIVRMLLESGHSVRVLDNFSTGRMENIRDLKGRIEIIKGDIRDRDTVKAAVKGSNYILHQAAFVSVIRSMETPREAADVNARGTLNVLACARDSGARRVIMASSSSIYGDSPRLPKEETMPLNPISPYALSKVQCEEWCGLFSRLYGLESVVLRYFNVFGPRQDPDSEYAAVIPRFIKAALEGREPVIFGDGSQTRDFTYVKNVAEANILALKGRPGTYNIGSGSRISLNEMVKALGRITGKGIKPSYSEPREGDVRHSLADISRAGEGLGYKPGTGFEEGLRETVRWFSEGTG